MLPILIFIGINLSRHLHPKPVDLDRLAYAVAVAETSNCTAGVGRSKHNCHSMRLRSGPFRTFRTPAESYSAFKEMWPRMYGNRFPTVADARKYTANPDPSRWLATVHHAYDHPAHTSFTLSDDLTQD